MIPMQLDLAAFPAAAFLCFDGFAWLMHLHFLLDP